MSFEPYYNTDVVLHLAAIGVPALVVIIAASLAGELSDKGWSDEDGKSYPWALYAQIGLTIVIFVGGFFALAGLVSALILTDGKP